jgi:hypothetical protein
VIWQKKNAWGVQKSNKKGMAPYQKDEQKQHKKKAGETNLLLNGRNMVGFWIRRLLVGCG